MWRRRESNPRDVPHGCAESGLVTMREMLDVDGPNAYPRSKDRATFDLRGRRREKGSHHICKRRAQALFEQIVSDSMH